MATRRAALAANSLLRAVEFRCSEICGGSGAHNRSSCGRTIIRCISSTPGAQAIQEMQMPSLSPTMEQGNIAKWTVAPGDSFSAGDIIAEIETDKAVMGWESQDDGYMARILFPQGSQDIPVGTVVAITVDDESELAAAANYAPGSSSSTTTAAPTMSASTGGVQPASPSVSASTFPAHQVWTMPALSPTMAQGNIAKWHKQVGDEVAVGDQLVDVETDKATMSWDSAEEGYVAKILAHDGTSDLMVGAPVVVVVEDADMVPAFASYSMDDAHAQAASPVAPAAPAPSAPSPPSKSPAPATPAPSPSAATPSRTASASGGRVAASPYAKKLAREAGLDITSLAGTGTGPGGRIVAANVQKAIASGSATLAAPADSIAVADGGFSDMAVNQIKKTTARRLLESKTTVPHYYLSVEVNMDSVAALRASLNEALADDGRKISVNDFVIKASAAALRKVPQVNSSWRGDVIRQYDNVDVTVAVQTDAGLMVPIVRDADIKGLAGISAEVKELASKAKQGKLAPHEYTGGTFAVSNLGMFGVKSFCAIVNPPQAAILACGGGEKKVVLGKDGTPRTVTTMTVTLSCDHRVIDGAVGATWLQAFKAFMEQPQTLML